MSESQFTLKAMPPRAARTALERARLQHAWEQVNDRTAIVVCAAAGFGKTTLMLQWRRQWMAKGALVAWMNSDADDEPERFTMALRHALRTAAGKPVELAAQCTAVPAVEALTMALSEIAMRGAPTVLMIDDAHTLPDATIRTVLQYLLMNAPPNLGVVIGTRARLPLQVAELAAKGLTAEFVSEDLRFRLEESMDVLVRRFGKRMDADDRARLHEITEGWPIGLQLAIAAIEGAPDLSAAVRDLSARRGTLQEYFVETMLTKMPPGMPEFLARIAILDPLSVPLCEAVTAESRAGAWLEWLVRETPMVMVGEHDDCMRLHPMARDFLLGRFERLPREERDALHARSAAWFADEERWHEAADHALAAGDIVQAESWAAKSLWALSTGGELSEAREWLERLPPKMLAGDAQLRLVAASILAFSDRNAEAQAFARTVLDDATTDAHTRVTALRAAAGAAAFADQLDMLPELLARWPLPGEQATALFNVSRLNVLALQALHSGETAQVRACVAEAVPYGDAGSLRLAAGLGRMLVGLSHLWDGDATQAAATLRPALLRAEREEGRRSLQACLIAAVLADALSQDGQIDEAQALLANRIDVLERCGMPDSLACAYKSIARIALARNHERGALGVLEDLCALADRRKLPRLRVQALLEQARIHAAHERAETVAHLVDLMEAMAPVFDATPLRWCRPYHALAVATAKGHAAIARHDLDDADAQFTTADALARRLRRGRDMQATTLWRAVVAQKRDAREAMPLMVEALSLAHLSGNQRLGEKAVATAVDLLEAMRVAKPGIALHKAQQSTRAAPSTREPRNAPSRSPLLTPKEAEIMQLLQNGMSNKQIANILGVSGETVKWHLKNLFVKLSAGTRKHAVDRAKLLGVVG